MQPDKSNQLIRLANVEDINQLVNICRLSFPWSLRWQAGKLLAKQWWQATLVSQAAEVWVSEKDAVLTAFCVLVIEENLWAREKSLRRGSNALTLISALCHPFVVSRHGGRIFKRVLKKKTTPDTHVPLPTEWNPGIRTWLELIAARPDTRGKGPAGILINQCAARTKELNRIAIALRVSPRNYPAKRLYEKHGYRCYQSDSHGELYARFLDLTTE